MTMTKAGEQPTITQAPDEREAIAALIVAGKNLRQHWLDTGAYKEMDSFAMLMRAKEMRRRDAETKKAFTEALEQVEFWRTQNPVTPRLEALPNEAPDEDWFEETISDSIDMDWRPRDAARAIVRHWESRWYPEVNHLSKQGEG